MNLSNIIDSFNQLFSRLSDWIYHYQNSQHSVGSSNYILLSLALGIITIGLIVEWVSVNEKRKKIFFVWWNRQHWAHRLLSGYNHPQDLPPDPMAATLPQMAGRMLVSAEGLSEQEASKRFAAGQNNSTHIRTSRSYRQIFLSNIFTRFNALLGTMYLIILLVGSTQDSLFGLIIVLNTIIGIIQELRAKWTLDKLALVMISKTHVVRGGKLRAIPTSTIVVDDIIELKSGDQVPVDGAVILSTNVEANESMVTGESEPVTKRVGDVLYSGSFIVAGSCRMQAVHIGEQAYARKLANAARQFASSKSELRKGINTILRYVTWLLIPTALLLFITQILHMQNGWRDALSASAGGVVNMIPDGLVLLTSVVMALAIVRLSKKRVLIQELPAVEMLARINVLCLDKTGTLTDGIMSVEKTIPLALLNPKSHAPSTELESVLGMFAHAQEKTSTLVAIGKKYPAPKNGNWTLKQNIPFSSMRKWSALSFEKYGTWILGAPEMVLPKKEFDLLNGSSEYAQLAKSGKRVLLLSYAETLTQTPDKKSFSILHPTPFALVVLQEQLRSGVKKTLAYFQEQGIAIKIISGDNPQTVAAVAHNAGIESMHPQNGLELPKKIDELGKIVEHNNIFGRILPEQKRLMVRALQKRGFVVAMVGDGVNDVLAIKEADFSIAMGSGTDSSRATAQLVLLDNTFTVLPDVIAEGRRIIANIERTANLFITKTAYVVIMAIAVGIALEPFPFLPRHLTLIGTFTVGVPALFLSFAKNTSRARPGFVKRVFKFSLPSGALIAALTLIAYALSRQIIPGNIELARTVATLTLFGSGFAMLILLAEPKTIWQKIFLGALAACMAVIFGIPSLRTLFGLEFLPFGIWIILILIVGACAYGLTRLKKKALAT